ncbi:ankyrin repeat protein [Ostertagia ostertagi]
MIGLLLETKDEEELEKLGMKDLMNDKPRRFSTAVPDGGVPSPPDGDGAPTPPKKVFVPKRKSRESTSSNEESKEHSPGEVLYMAKHEQWPNMENELDNVKRSDFSMSDQHGFTALMFAVKEGKRILFEKLLAKGADINVVTKDLRNVAHICAMYSDKDMLDAIIMRNRELLRRPGGA